MEHYFVPKSTVHFYSFPYSYHPRLRWMKSQVSPADTLVSQCIYRNAQRCWNHSVYPRRAPKADRFQWNIALFPITLCISIASSRPPMYRRKRNLLSALESHNLGMGTCQLHHQSQAKKAETRKVSGTQVAQWFRKST